MSKALLLKNVRREISLFNDRIVIAGLCVILLAILLLSRLVYLQIGQHQHFTTLSENNRLKLVPIVPTRGLIYDRNGVILAENQPSFSLELIPEKVRGNIDELLFELQEVVAVSPADIDRFKRFMKQKRRFENVPLRFRLSEQEVARIVVERHRFPGVHINASLGRYYPLGEHAVHAIGYVGRINEAELNIIDASNYSGTTHIGKIGIEQSYEKELHGQVGWQRVETDVQGRVLRVLERTPPLPGKNLYLNMDINLQKYAEELLQGRRASLVALEPASGAVLALVSMPRFDPNLFVNGIDQENYSKLRQSPDRPLFNRALRGQYPPGSTIKPIVGLAGVEYGASTWEQRILCPGWYQLAGKERKYRDWKKGGHGFVDFHHAVEQSCDVYFYDLAHNLGIDKLAAFLRLFGLGKDTGVDISGELHGLIPDSAWKKRTRNIAWYPGETLISGIGQGFMLTTPMQLAVAVATLGTRGHTRQPRLGFAMDGDKAGKMQIINSPAVTRVNLKHQEGWLHVIDAMRAVVHGERGTARRQAIGAVYDMAGKTGTAQVVGIKQDEEYDEDKLDERHLDHALFISFAPLDNPRIALAVIVENGGGGSSTAAPIARKVMDYYLLGKKAEVKEDAKHSG